MAVTDTTVSSSISIAIIDMTAITSDLLRHSFANEPGYEVVGCARTMQEAVDLVISRRPDVAIINSCEKNSSFAALALLEEFSRIGSPVRTVVISTHLTDAEAAAYLRAHARAVLSGADTDFDALCRCTSAVFSGQIWANNEHLVCLVDSLPRSSLRVVNQRGKPILSLREEEVLRLLATGLSNRDLAATLHLSEHTVKNHLFRIFDKLGVCSRIEAVLYATHHQENARPLAKPIFSVKEISAHRAQSAGWQPARNSRLAVVDPPSHELPDVRSKVHGRRREVPRKAVDF